MTLKYFRVTFFKKGKKEQKIIRGMSRQEAILAAQKMNLGRVVEVREIPVPLEERIKYLRDLIKSRLLRKKVNIYAYIAALRQLTVMVKAGISLKDSLEDIGQYTEDETVKEIFLKAAEAIDSGKTLSSVFEEYEAYIGGVSVAMIRLGEQTGDIVMALDNLARIYEKMADNRKRMVKALRYPVITLFAIAGAFTFLVLFVVPKFKAIFAELHADLPLPTKILLGAEYILSHYGWAVALGLVGLVIFHSFMYKTSKKYKYRADQVALRTYLIKDVILYGSLQRFLMVLGTLVKSGIPLIDALKISQGIMGNSVLQEKITFIIRGINQGRGLGEMLREVDLLDFIALKMIEAGEKSGELDTMLQKASNYYDDKFDAVVDNMQAAIEPIMMLVIGGLVLLIALGVFLPMWNLGQAVKHG
jgi:general secretion pathway protein F/MSHA biogenesis protein MshG